MKREAFFLIFCGKFNISHFLIDPKLFPSSAPHSIAHQNFHPHPRILPPRMGFKFPSRGATSSSTSTSSTSKLHTIANLIIRFLQFVFAVTVLGLYGRDIHSMRNANDGVDSRWAYAEVVGAFAALTSLVFMIPQLKSYLAFAWDGVLL